MTVSSTTFRTTVLGNGATSTFAYAFAIPAAANASLIYTDAGGAQTILDPVSWSITGIGGTGGTFTYPLSGSPIAAGTSLTLLRSTPRTQAATFPAQGMGTPAATEAALDALTMMVQELPGWGTVPVQVSVSAAMQPILAAPSTAAALAGLGVLAGGLSFTGWLQLDGSANSMRWHDPTQGVNAKYWDIESSSGTLHLRALNDAYSASNDWATVVRTGYAITSITLNAASIILNGPGWVVAPPSRDSTQAIPSTAWVYANLFSTASDVAASRALGVVYTNSTGRPMAWGVSVGTTSTNVTLNLLVGGVVMASQSQSLTSAWLSVGTCIVPPGATYEAALTTGTGTLGIWGEAS